MKKSIIFALACMVSSSLYAADGAEIYKKCVACHGQNADMKYANKVPALNSVAKEERAKALEDYKLGTGNKFGMGGVMKAQMSKLGAEEIAAVNDYIETLKK